MSTKRNDSTLDHFPKSYWLEQSVPQFPTLNENITTDIAVIGGGMVGIITAYRLAKAGKDVTLIESGTLVSGVTGNTTAKLSAQHGLIYSELIKTFNEDKARLYYDANMEGIRFVKETSDTLDIDCDFEDKEAVVFATSEKGKKQIEKEARAYESLSINGYLTNGQVSDLPFPTEAALTMAEQAQFHPVKFLSKLAEEIRRLGGKIYQYTRAVGLLKQKTGILTEHGAVIDANQIIVTTHYPFNDFRGLYFSKLTIKRSYALVAEISGTLPEQMYISVESPTRSLRTVKDENGKPLLLIGGESHQTGKSSVPTQEHYQNLKTFGEQWFSLSSVLNHWSAQDMTTLDKLPYIGQMTRTTKNVYVATGFNKWGMAMGATAGKILSDIVLERPNAYTHLFNPTRSKFKLKDATQFTKKNAAVSKDLIWTKAKRPDKTPDDLKADEGGIVSVDGKKLGGYRDKEGTLHLIKTTCTHMGCGLEWNDGERSWDCPCHGSRFSYSGEVLNGPAVKPLKRMD
ncbi:MAG: FAD-dependent oxidoreductase [Alkalibacterium sp.]|nr:FAD-dependent oxidoreductase [Alkalibacterium sp.]